MAKFPTPEWVDTIKVKLNNDEQYARIARNWEGDLLITVDPSGGLKEPFIVYLDLWHGKCRDAVQVSNDIPQKPVVALNGQYDHFVRLLKGEMEPMQALLTRKLSVHGSMAILMRNVPTVLDFVRCCREITDSFE